MAENEGDCNANPTTSVAGPCNPQNYPQPLTNHPIYAERDDAETEVNETPVNLNQAANLPEGPIQLPQIEDVFDGKANWVEWERKVKSILASKSLHRLIDKKIPRSQYAPMDTTANRWRSCSTNVATWLLRGISVTLYDEIQIPHYESTFADDLWNALKTTCQPRHVHHDLKTWKASTDIGASDYTSLEVYTAAYSDVYFEVREAVSRPDPYALILDFLAEIQLFNPPLADSIMQQLQMEDRRHDEYSEVKMTLPLTVPQL
ncbi:unnamed protein product [Penicillium pancosmium]